MAKNEEKRKYHWYDLHIFGFDINPYLASVVGLLMIIFQQGTTIGILLLLLGAYAAYKQKRKKIYSVKLSRGKVSSGNKSKQTVTKKS